MVEERHDFHGLDVEYEDSGYESDEGRVVIHQAVVGLALLTRHVDQSVTRHTVLPNLLAAVYLRFSEIAIRLFKIKSDD